MHHCYDSITNIQNLKKLYDNYKYDKTLNLMKDVEFFKSLNFWKSNNIKSEDFLDKDTCPKIDNLK